MNPKRLVLFDLDGVIIDSRENMACAWDAVRMATGTSVPFDEYFAQIGYPFRDIMERLGLSDIAAEAEKVFRTASMRNIGIVTFFDGVSEVLDRLQAHGTKIGIVTSKDVMRTNAILALLSTGFHVVQTPNSNLRGKPAPDHLLAAMASANVDPADSVFIGDMMCDAEAARRARIDYIHVTWGYGARPSEDTPSVDTWPDLLSVVGVPGP